MNRVNRVRGRSLASVILFCLGMVSPAWPADSGSIRVTIYHADGSPMEDALVTLHRGRDGPMMRQARTCDDGLVLLDDLEPADYEVIAAKPEYGTIVISPIKVLAGRRVSLPLVIRLANIQPSSPPIGAVPQRGPGSVRVEVREFDGGPMQDAQVTLHARRDGPVIREARTDGDGVVLFEDLDPVEYVIRAAKPEYVTLVLPGVEVADGRRFPVRLTLRRADSPRPCDPPVVGVTR